MEKITICTKRQFKQRTAEQKSNLLDEKDKKSTQRATAGAMKQFQPFLSYKKPGTFDSITKATVLNDILCDFYPLIRPIKDYENYSTRVSNVSELD